MSYHSITLLEGNLLDSTKQIRDTWVELDGIVLHLDGRMVIGNLVFPPRQEINQLRIDDTILHRPNWSDTVSVAEFGDVSGTRFGLRYAGDWPCKHWARLIPATPDAGPLHGDPPSRWAQAFNKCERIVVATSNYMIHLMMACCSGFDGGKSP